MSDLLKGKTNFADLKETVAREGVTRKSFSGDNSMLVLNTIQPSAGPALHKHPHEQITYILAGHCEFTLGEETFPMGPGDVVLIPPNVPHALKPLGNEAVLNFDVFSPVREDYK